MDNLAPAVPSRIVQLVAASRIRNRFDEVRFMNVG